MTPSLHKPAFTLDDGDRFHIIQISGVIRYDADPSKTLIGFYIVRRSSGLFDLVNVVETFKGKRCVSRRVQTKPGIDDDRIEPEIDAIETVFSRMIEKATGYRIKWRRLDLARIEDRSTQIAAITHWLGCGKAELGGIGMN